MAFGLGELAGPLHEAQRSAKIAKLKLALNPPKVVSLATG